MLSATTSVSPIYVESKGNCFCLWITTKHQNYCFGCGIYIYKDIKHPNFRISFVNFCPHFTCTIISILLCNLISISCCCCLLGLLLLMPVDFFAFLMTNSSHQCPNTISFSIHLKEFSKFLKNKFRFDFIYCIVSIYSCIDGFR